MTCRLPLGSLNDLPPPSQYTPWLADLQLGFAREGKRCVLRERRHVGPLRVQKPLYPEGGEVCQTILLHPPSGIVGGDQLTIAARVGEQAHAQLVTPGAGKWYRSGGAEASQSIRFSVAANATLEWLPQETIVFDGARANLQMQVALAADSRYFGWDILCLGRSASGERFSHGNLTLHTRVERDGQPIWIERGQVVGNDPLLTSAAGWAGASVCGTLLATLQPGDEAAALLDACRELAPADAAEHGMTLLPSGAGLLLARYLGHSSEAARHWFIALWQVLRPALIGRDAVPPRIWTT